MEKILIGFTCFAMFGLGCAGIACTLDILDRIFDLFPGTADLEEG